MAHRLRRGFTFANVCSCIALIVALGTGGAYAANTVGSDDIIDESIQSVDIKNGARFSDEVRQFEVSLIRTALGRTSGSQTRAAKLLGLKPTTLNAKIKRYGIMA